MATVLLGLGTAGTVWAYARAADSTGHQFLIFWSAQLIVLLPLAVWLSSARSLRPAGRVGALIVYAAFNLVPKLWLSPSAPYYHDEFGHFRQALNILSTGNPEPANTYLPIIQHFPLLELVTVAVHEITRLSIWHAGLVVVGLSHLAVLPLIYGITRQFCFGQRYSSLSALVYSTNPSFQYFDTQYSYESLGLTLAFATIYCLLRTTPSSCGSSPTIARRWAALGLLAAAACVSTHHLSAIFMSIVCVGIAALTVHRRTELRRGAATWTLAVASAAMTAVWLGVAAPQTGGYIGPHVTPAFDQLAARLGLGVHPAGIVVGNTVEYSRSVFAGSLAPAFEKFCSFATPVLMLFAVLAGAWVTFRTRLISRQLLILPGCLSLAYFASLPFTLTLSGGEGAHRSWAYTYIGVSLLAPGAGSLARRRRIRPTLLQCVGVIALGVVAVGNVAAGENVYYRFPGAYVFGNDTRSLTPETIFLARWLNQHIIPGTRVVTDRYTGQAIEGYTRLSVPSPSEGAAYQIYRSGASPSPSLRQFLLKHHFEVFVLDRHILHEFPQGIFYQGYIDYSDVNVGALRRMLVGSSFAQPIYQTQNFTVFKLNP